jgi:hypothetical protein
MRATMLLDERVLVRWALWLVFGCCLLVAGCGKQTRLPLSTAGGSEAGFGGAGDAGGNDAVAAGRGSEGEDGTAGEGEGAAAAEGAGTAAAGGAGAAAGDGAGGAGGERPDGCTDLSHFEDTMRMKWDLRVIGMGFEAHEGGRLRVVVTYSGEPSYALGETTIESGSFEVFLPGVIEPYTGIGVYIDKGRDDACTIDEDGLFTKTTGGVFRDEVWEITPDEPDPAGAMPCVINGIFDLTVPLPCP